jgi:hypothetical protein
MQATALFPDGFRTGRTLNGQIAQNSLQRGSFSKIYFIAFTSVYPTQSPVCRFPILAREPSGLGLLIQVKALILRGAAVPIS